MESFNHFPEAAKAFHEAMSQVVRKTAFDVQGHAASTAPIETGFLRNSIYVVTHDESTYGGATPSKPDSYLLPEIDKAENDTTAWIAVGANYGIYLELGTRFMPPKPYLAPAVEMVRPTFEDAFSRIEDAMKAQGL
jgi:bacteriophage HK97-gp10 putative tail-component